MKKTFSVNSWEKFQHYKDRNPPWIKLHNHLLDDYNFECLPDATKCHLLCIWMLASRTNNKMVFDNSWVKRKIGANSTVDLELLLSAGFIELQSQEQDASNALVSEEKRREEKRRGEESRVDKVSQKLDYSSWPSMPSTQVLNDWLAMRKRLKANVTQTVINRISKQLCLAHKNGFSVDDCLSECQVRNWRGFEYEWIAKNKKPSMHDNSQSEYKTGDL